MPAMPVPAAPSPLVQLYPRRKAGAGAVPAKGRLPVELTRAAIEAFFGQPQPTAAQELGISLTALKQVCRRLGVERWPYVRPCKPGGRIRRRRASAGPPSASTPDLGAASGNAAATIVSPHQSDDSHQGADSFRFAAQRAAASCCAYYSDSDDSCGSAETQLARTPSAASEAGTVPCLIQAARADEDDNMVERACHSAAPWTPARAGACGVHSLACAGPGEIFDGDSLGWLVGCESGDADGSLEHAWQCLERCCQAQQGGGAPISVRALPPLFLFSAARFLNKVHLQSY